MSQTIENAPEDSFVEKMRRKAIELGFKVSVDADGTLLFTEES